MTNSKRCVSHGWEVVREVWEVSDKLKEVCIAWMGSGERGVGSQRQTKRCVSHRWEGVREVWEVGDKLKEVCIAWMGRGERGVGSQRQTQRGVYRMDGKG